MWYSDGDSEGQWGKVCSVAVTDLTGEDGGEPPELLALHDQLAGHPPGDPAVRVRPPEHLRHLRPDRAGAGPALGAADTRTRRLHRR